jgi:hypothetical protein
MVKEVQQETRLYVHKKEMFHMICLTDGVALNFYIGVDYGCFHVKNAFLVSGIV